MLGYMRSRDFSVLSLMPLGSYTEVNELELDRWWRRPRFRFVSIVFVQKKSFYWHLLDPVRPLNAYAGSCKNLPLRSNFCAAIKTLGKMSLLREYVWEKLRNSSEESKWANYPRIHWEGISGSCTSMARGWPRSLAGRYRKISVLAANITDELWRSFIAQIWALPPWNFRRCKIYSFE